MRSKEYFLKLSEQIYNDLPDNEKLYLNNLGLEVRQLPTNDDLQNDEKVKFYKKEISKNYQSLNDYLFDIRNK
jgi:hypothetical protein